MSLGVIVIFGGATLISHDETFIKFKPSVLYIVMALALIVGEYGFGKNFIKQLMSSQMQVPDPVWRVLVNAWGLFFIGMSALNLWVAYNFDTDTWVNFKMFGGMGLMFVFVLGQAIFLAKYMKQDDPLELQAGPATASLDASDKPQGPQNPHRL